MRLKGESKEDKRGFAEIFVICVVKFKASTRLRMAFEGS